MKVKEIKPFDERSYLIGKQEGERGVLEWLDGEFGKSIYWRTISTTGKDYYIPLSLADTWQDKIKELRRQNDQYDVMWL